ncbi:hypothetical protein BH09VER1_BH09VER1_09920 [soil metagenome]
MNCAKRSTLPRKRKSYRPRRAFGTRGQLFPSTGPHSALAKAAYLLSLAFVICSAQGQSAPGTGTSQTITSQPKPGISVSTPVQPQAPPQLYPTVSSQLSPPPFEVYADYNWGNAMAEKLRNAAPKLYNFDRASLRDVLRFLADDAGIPFVALQESSAVDNALVTFTLKASPFLTLETVARANGVALFYENGVWFMRPINEKEMIGRIYRLKYNPQENVTYNGGGSQSGATTGVDSGGGGSGGGIPNLNINIQGASEVFKVKTPETVDQIKKLLGIPTTGMVAKMVAEGSVENFGTLRTPPGLDQTGGKLNDQGPGIGENGAQVIYNSDANTLYIVATRQQHQWVEGYLSAVDRPQALIGIEVKFFETTKDPRKELGIDWAGTLQGGYNVKASGIQANINSVTIQNQPLGVAVPVTAVISAHDVAINFKAFLSDRDVTTVSYPRVLTLNNREVVIRSVVNQPVLASTSSVTPGVGGTTTASVSYLPIGTIINVLPKTMPDGSVMLNVAITVSSIIGTEIIQQNNYPIASSRVYNATLQVTSGYTLAIGGLAEALDNNARNGVPLLKDIPLVGELFKSKTLSRTRKNLMIFITPTIITDRTKTAGIATNPESVIPIRADDPVPPTFSPSGRLVGGAAGVDDALSWLERQVQYFRQINEDKTMDKTTIKQLEGLMITANLIISEIQRLQDDNPRNMDQLIRKEERGLLAVRELKKVRVRAGQLLMGY